MLIAILVLILAATCAAATVPTLAWLVNLRGMRKLLAWVLYDVLAVSYIASTHYVREHPPWSVTPSSVATPLVVLVSFNGVLFYRAIRSPFWDPKPLNDEQQPK